MGLAAFLILFPLLPALLMWFVRGEKARAIIVYVAGTVIILASITVGVLYLTGYDQMYIEHSGVVKYTLFAVDLILSIIVATQAIRYKRKLPLALAVVQIVLTFVIEIGPPDVAYVEFAMYVDTLSAIMVLIIGIIGSLIVMYAVGYMQDFNDIEKAKAQAAGLEYKDRRYYFFTVMFVFLSGMFLIVFSNNLNWFFTGWEVTTVCSFMLIGYTKTDEAIHNSFIQIIYNMLGGISFAIAIIIIAATANTLDLQLIVKMGQQGLLLFPIGLMCFSSLTKMAQMPFQSWLLGAMVAPTPTSALLHSSTMVKAGCFMLIKLSPCLGMNFPGMMVAIVGGVTFTLAAAMAISEHNGKRVLAYSTISNLGLIAACAGLGTPEGAWAAVFLMIFHAVTKAMLFMCVGTAEHHIGSRDIEDMDNLFERMPSLARAMGVGIMCMFVAPFGMLVSKWASIVSILEVGYIPILFLILFGSSITTFFWAKWLGKIMAVGAKEPSVEEGMHGCERLAIVACLVLTLAVAILIPVISGNVVVPYFTEMYEDTFNMNVGNDDLVITSILVIVLVVTYLIFFGREKVRKVPVYMAGVGRDMEKRTFSGSMGESVEATQRNWYITEWFSAKVLNLPGNLIAICVIGVTLLATFLMGGVL